MIISIIGTGALGKTYGGLLQLAGHDVHYLVRSEAAALQKAKRFQIHLRDSQQTLSIENPHIYTQPDDLPASDLVIIAIKTTGNEALPHLLKACVKPHTRVLIIQNGIGNEEMISALTGDCPLICGIATIGAGRYDEADVEVAFIGNLKFAPYRQKDLAVCDEIIQAFANAPVHLPITVHEQYRTLRWQKLAWNIPFGALSILFDLPTHQLAGEEPYRTMVLQIMAEIDQVAQIEGLGLSEEFRQQWVNFTKNAGPYWPTLYRDFHEGKRIEKEYIIDNVLKIAQGKPDCILPMLTIMQQHLSKMLSARKVS